MELASKPSISAFNASISLPNSSFAALSITNYWCNASISLNIYVFSVSSWVMVSWRLSVISNYSSYFCLSCSNSPSRLSFPFIMSSILCNASSSYDRRDKMTRSFSMICAFNSLTVLSASAIKANLVFSSSISILAWLKSAFCRAFSYLSLLIYSCRPGNDSIVKLNFKIS